MSAPAGHNVIEVRGLVNRFGPQVVHDGVDLQVRRGEIFGIVGGSGSGKSVLLRSILGLQRPAAGTVKIEGHDITTLTEEQMRAVKRSYGVTFQHGALFTALTVLQNVKLPLAEYYPMQEEALDDIARFRLALAGLPPDAGAKYPAQLSGGMIKRAALARALALDPTLLFLDEPTAGLDPIAAAAFDELLLDLQGNLGLTVVMITHDLDTIFRTCNRVGVLVDRRLVVDTVQGIVAYEHPWIQRYFHGPRARAVQPARA